MSSNREACTLVPDIALSEDCSLMRQNLWLQKIKKRGGGAVSGSAVRSSLQQRATIISTATCTLKRIVNHFPAFFCLFKLPRTNEAVERACFFRVNSQLHKSKPPLTQKPWMWNNRCFYTVFLFFCFFDFISLQAKPFSRFQGALAHTKETLHQNIQRCLVGDFSVTPRSLMHTFSGRHRCAFENCDTTFSRQRKQFFTKQLRKVKRAICRCGAKLPFFFFFFFSNSKTHHTSPIWVYDWSRQIKWLSFQITQCWIYGGRKSTGKFISTLSVKPA